MKWYDIARGIFTFFVCLIVATVSILGIVALVSYGDTLHYDNICTSNGFKETTDLNHKTPQLVECDGVMFEVKEIYEIDKWGLETKAVEYKLTKYQPQSNESKRKINNS